MNAAYAELGISVTASPLIFCNTARTSGQFESLLGHKDISTTMIYTHVLQQGGQGVRSPLDDLM